MKFKLLESKEDKQKLIDYAGEDLAKRFFEVRHNIHDGRKNDLYYWLERPVQELSDYIYKFDKKEGLVYNDSDWKVYKIKSPEMLSNLIGRHKIWCIQNNTGDIGLDWNYHVNKLGTQYYLYISKLDGAKYIRGINQNDFMEDGVWDEGNRKVRDKNLLSILPDIT